MTDYSSSALGDLMGRILDNVIRRAVTEFEWFGTADDGFQGNGWDGRLPPTFGPSGTVRLRYNALAQTDSSPAPPGARYVGEESQGSMLYLVYEIDPYETIYKPWIDRVNDVFEGWRSLPDPADFEGPRTRLEDAVDALTPEAQRDGGFTFVDVGVSNAIGLMHTWISPSGGSSSDLLYSFDAVYGVNRITGVMTNQAQVAAGAGLAVAGVQQVWTKARRDIMTIASDAAEALDVSAGGDFSIDLGVVKAFVDLVGVFVPAQLEVLTDAVSQGLGFLDEVTPEPRTSSREVTVTGGTAEEIFSSLETAIRDLDTSIYEEELELVTKLRTLQDILGGAGGQRGPDDFQLHPGAGMDDTFTEASEIRIDSLAVQDIGSHQVPIIAAAFLRAAEHAAADTGEGIWTRDSGIGYGTSGAWLPWSQVLEQLDAITTGSARELIDAGRMLAQAAGWIEDSDAASAAALAGHADELARGKDEWSYG